MDPVRLHRLRRLTRDELAHRVRVLTRTEGQRIGAVLRRPAWDRRALPRAVATGLLEPDVLDCIRRADWAQVNASLRALLAARPSRFILDPQTAAPLRRAIVSRWPAAVAHAAERGNAVLEGRHDVLGYESLVFARAGQALDWHFDPVHERSAPIRFWADVHYLDPATGDHKVIWEVNRQQHLLVLARAWWLTGDPRYRDALAAEIPSWMAANPPLVGINWASMLELAFRSMSWLWALHALLGDAPDSGAAADAAGWLVDLLVGLDRQLTHVEQNLSRYFSPNTHLTGEALALYVAGAALPELRASARWLDTGREILLAELPKQVGRDGGHVERSTHYHRYTLDFYLLALLTSERIGDDAAPTFRDAASRLAEFMLALVDDRGWMPQVGDDDGGMLWPIAGRDPRDVRDSLGLAAVILERPDLAPWGVPEEAFWVGWHARPEAFAESPVAVHDRRPLASCVRAVDLEDTGFVAMRNASGDHLVFDVGPHGYLNGGHAHADALAITLALDAAPLLIDPGTATYTMNPALRDRMRSTALHNTLTLDGRPASVSAGPFRWHSRADARRDVMRHNPGFAWSEAHHDGYAPARHRRTVVHGPDTGWLIVDEVVAAGQHTAQLHWHFAPAWRVACERDGQLRAVDDDGRQAWLLHDGGDMWLGFGDDDSGLGWCSPRYGSLIPTCAVRITRSGIGPISLVTWIDIGDTVAGAPTLERLEADADREAPAIAVAIRRGSRMAMTLLRPGDAADRDTRSAACGDYHTDARLLQFATRDGLPISISIADGSHAMALSERWLSVSADRPMADLHLAREGERLELWSTSPPERLHVHGLALASVTSARLNGRDLRVDGAAHDASLTIASTDWHEGVAPSADGGRTSVTTGRNTTINGHGDAKTTGRRHTETQKTLQVSESN
jgi:hypothetical protein